MKMMNWKVISFEQNTVSGTIMSWGHTEKNCKFKVGFNGVVPYYTPLLWSNKYLSGQCWCLILIVTLIDATCIEGFKIPVLATFLAICHLEVE